MLQLPKKKRHNLVWEGLFRRPFRRLSKQPYYALIDREEQIHVKKSGKRRDFQDRFPYSICKRGALLNLIAACAAASLAIGTRYGEQET